MKQMNRFYKFSYLAYILIFSFFGFIHSLQASNEGLKDVAGLLSGSKERDTSLHYDRKNFEKSFVIKGGSRNEIVVKSTYEDKKFTLTKIHLKGATVYSEEKLQALFRSVLNKEVQISEVVNVVKQIVKKYWDDGYVLAEATLETLDALDGDQNLTIQIYEGQIKNVNITGKTEGIETLIKSYIELLKNSDPFRMDVVDNIAFLSEMYPGIRIKGKITPLKDVKGGGDIEFTVDREKFIPYASIENRGSNYLGPERVNLGGLATSLLRDHDITGANFIFTPGTNELRYGRATHRTPLNSAGTALELRGDYAKFRPGSVLRPQHIDGRSSLAQIAISHPFELINDHHLSIKGGFELLNNKATSAEKGLLYTDRIHDVFLTLSDGFMDRWKGRNIIEARFTQGLNIDHNRNVKKEYRSKAEGKYDFTKLNFEMVRTQSLLNSFSLMGRFKAQYSFDSLLSPVQCYFGSYPYGSGYDTAEISGDHGLAGR
ncbi:MAG: ShlB/FhaC/HecB family hemolysin secretion/activation protein, partial [Alphaproteobacteria bacterium]|nr:ShlB/FhaC/HecB family hemolysin secretion/activation protein [Alphaproteobacteria bacterium]